MTKEIYSELNSAQEIIYTPSMITRAFPDFTHGEISNIYRVGKNCVVKRMNGIEEKYPADLIQAAYLKFIGREVPYFSYLGPGYRGPIPWSYKKNTYVLLKGWTYAYQESYKTAESKFQQQWMNSFNNVKNLEALKCLIENSNDDDSDEKVLPDVKEALGHIITPYEYCSCQAFQKQVRNLEEFEEEFSGNYQPRCKHLHWYDKFKLFQRKRTELTDDLQGRVPKLAVVWYYIPPQHMYGKGTFKILWTKDGLYSELKNWKTISSLSQWDAWDYFDRMIKKGFVPYELSAVPKLKTALLCEKS